MMMMTILTQCVGIENTYEYIKRSFNYEMNPQMSSFSIFRPSALLKENLSDFMIRTDQEKIYVYIGTPIV